MMDEQQRAIAERIVADGGPWPGSMTMRAMMQDYLSADEQTRRWLQALEECQLELVKVEAQAQTLAERVQALEETAEYHQHEAAKQFGYVKRLQQDLAAEQARVLALEEALREAAEAWPTPNRYSELANAAEEPAGRTPQVPTSADPELKNLTEPGREPREGWLP